MVLEKIPEQAQAGIGLQDNQVSLIFLQVGLGCSFHITAVTAWILARSSALAGP